MSHDESTPDTRAHGVLAPSPHPSARRRLTFKSDSLTHRFFFMIIDWLRWFLFVQLTSLPQALSLLDILALSIC